MIDNKNVGKKIAAMRLEQSLTQQQLAVMMNVSHQAVSKWESGQTLPDIQTMIELTRFFGITIEQLVSDEEEICREDAYPMPEPSDTNAQENEGTAEHSEVKNMNIHELLQMAPYMSREVVEEIALEIEDELTTAQIARIAPYVRAESLEKLIERHHPQFTWETLRRIAPYMRREAVDALAKDIASGKETVKPAGENINKALGDLGKAFDDIGHDMKHAVKKGLRFGKNVFREVSSAFERAQESEKKQEPEKESAPLRSARAMELRRMAFERAVSDQKWDWLAEHIGEIEGDAQLRSKIAAAAKEAGMQDWICSNMGDLADAATIEAAIETGNWEWLASNALKMDAELQEKVALAAVKAENWQWLMENSDQLNLRGCALVAAQEALKAGEGALAVQLAQNHLLPEEASVLAKNSFIAGDYETLDMLIPIAEEAVLDDILLELGKEAKWDEAKRYVHIAMGKTIEELMIMAVEQGNFDAVDLLDDYL